MFCQEYGSYVLENDTITEGGDDLLFHNEYIYTISLTRCQPDAQSCTQLRKFDSDFNLMWSMYFPSLRKANENGLHVLNDSTLLLAGRNNSINPTQAFYHYVIHISGEIVSMKSHELPYESNINLGNYLQDSVLFMFGTSREFLSTEGINVDALLAIYDFRYENQVIEYFDYDDNFYVDIYDLQPWTDSTLVFISRRRNFMYGSERDYVVEEILPDMSRRELYKIKVDDETGITNAPSLEVLSDGKIAFFKPDTTYLNGSVTVRILDQKGSFEKDIILWEEIFPDIQKLYNMSRTTDGGFLLSGNYLDRTHDEPSSTTFNGMIGKVSADGVLEWIRQYKHRDNITGEPVRSFLFDVKELPNGDIIATGNVENITSDLWVIKTNSEGCLGEDDCGETTVSITDEIIKTNYINVYPNPVIIGGDLQVEVSSQISGKVPYRMYGIQGEIISSGLLDRGHNMVDTSSLVSGIYTMQVDLGVRGVESHQVVVR
jgi:hypothetical protein